MNEARSTHKPQPFSAHQHTTARMTKHESSATRSGPAEQQREVSLAVSRGGVRSQQRSGLEQHRGFGGDAVPLLAERLRCTAQNQR